ncbi:MAG: protein translocase subunit SecD [Candidatus Pacebacteria bacterium]|nr:protein translocase subunit SecD [Candidatus Paceibacterota bacterium]
MNRSKTILFLVILCVVTIIGALFIVQSDKLNPIPGKKWLNEHMPWKLGLDLVGGAHLTYKIDMSQVPDANRQETAAGLRDVIEKRINLFGVREPQVVISQSGGDYYLIIELAGVSDVSKAIDEIGLTPYLDFRAVQGEGDKAVYVPTALNGKYIKRATLEFNQTTAEAQVALEFTTEGGKLFEQITEQNVGKVVGIFLDNQPISEPVVREKISGGKAVISGNFTAKTAKELVQRFNAGALPAPIALESQQTVGASLGRDSLNKSLLAGLIGTLVIMLFMISYYRFNGVLASIALAVYIVFSLIFFKIFVTLSLAGIAGFLLSIGMAVDANILIFERTKEELKRGLAKGLAIKEGFRRAWPSIRDSNVSTMITTFILFNFTSSFVKGLALTLFIGVVISMFTAITVTRNLMRVFVKEAIH